MSTSRKLLIVSVIIIILGVAFVMWWNAQNAVPNIKIPTPVMPSPNAYDYYFNAVNSIVETEKISSAIIDSPRSTPTGLDRVYSLAEKEALVARNAQALKLLREGFTYEYMSPPVRSLFCTNFSHLAKYRGMARLLVLEGQTKAGHDDWGGAMNSYLDAFRLGEDTPRGGCLIEKLTGIAIQAIARSEAWNAVDHLTAEEATTAAGCMEEIMAHRVPMSETFEQEKWLMTASLMEIFKAGDAFQLVRHSQASSKAGPSKALIWLRLKFYNKRKILNNIMYYMDDFAAHSRLPYAAKTPEPAIPNDDISQALLPVFSRARFADIKCEVENALLLTALGLRAYRMEHGEYPKMLAELTPKYLKKLPDDPFAPKGTLQYKMKGSTYVLYSLGPDCKDDGGKPIDDPSKVKYSPNDRYRIVDPDSKGDIVAGINTR